MECGIQEWWQLRFSGPAPLCLRDPSRDQEWGQLQLLLAV